MTGRGRPMVDDGGGVIQNFIFEFLKGLVVGIRRRSRSEDDAATLGTLGEERRWRCGTTTEGVITERERGSDGWSLGMRGFTGRGGPKAEWVG
jgi:hypothetical protein